MHTPLDRERHAAISLREQAKAILGDDEQALADLVEGETSFNEVALDLAERAKELEAKAEACANRIGELKARKERLEHTAEKMRRAIGTAMLDIGLKSIPGATLTVSARVGNPGADVTNESLLPDWAWRVVSHRKPDLIAIKAHVLGGETVPGAVKTNGQIIVTLRSQ